MSETSELLEALRGHYIEPGAGLAGGTFVPEVGVNGGFGHGRRCDAIYVGFTSGSGRILVGHELKVSRADWRHELAQADKADFWHDNTHAWYIVAPSTTIVPPDELPFGWGLMVPKTRGRRFRIVKASPARDITPSWDSMRSIFARMDTLQAQEIQQRVKERVDKYEADRKKRDAERPPPLDYDVEKNQRALAAFREQFGMELSTWTHRNQIAPDDLRAAIALHQQLQQLPGRHEGWQSGFQSTLDELQQATARVTAAHEALTRFHAERTSS